MKRCFPLLLAFLTIFVSCESKKSDVPAFQKESEEAKNLLQGIWIDAETEEVAFRAKGDTIFYSDSTAVPAYFCIVADSLVLGTQRYAIVKQSPHLFWFQNQSGDVVKLRKSEDPNDSLVFTHEQPKALTIVSEMLKKDSVVVYGGERYHWYIAISPTRYKVTKTSYSDDGFEVENVYYDNTIHVSVYKGTQKLFSRNLRKQIYDQQVPDQFLKQAVLGNMQFESVDENGFHFNATICVPDGAACYLVATNFSFVGEMSMKVMEY